MHAAHRFLDIQIISNKLGVAPVAHSASPSHCAVYKPISASGHGNSFCLVVKILDSNPKVTGSIPPPKTPENLKGYEMENRTTGKEF
ncbi:hypothetical protein AVEN_97157-1 [Araneus ventricosus]|uniref:Uncharacterized protein n=1 Tax=Araneus ventricosus TaxID=182803 RepID=A0A4Y2DF21_ARAVE|nr:hypothetical protein AVEN_97157-1 [Araneus ventricosus]